MSYIIILALMIWAISSIVKSASAKKAERNRQRQIARLNAEAKQRQMETARLREEWKQRQAEAKAEVQRMVAIEREQIRQAKELEKHEAMLRKHDEEIAKLNFKIAQAQEDIEFLTFRLDDLEESLNTATNEALAYHNSGDAAREERTKRKIITLQNQIHTTENKLNKAMFMKEQAERKLA